MKILSFDVGIVNLAYCIIDNDLKIEKWEIITIPSEKKFSAHISTSGVSELYINLIKELDNRKFMLDVDIVLIEKQPSFNPKMRIIAGCLQTYFYIRGVVDKVDPIKSVEFFSPKNKLKCYTGPALDISKNGKTVKGKYAQTKKMGVAIARVKLQEYSETNFVDFFEKNKKKDDLSDCYLQALTYISFKKVKVQSQVQVQVLTKVQVKKQLKEFLDSQIKNCSVLEIMEKNFRSIHELEFPFELSESIELLLTKLSMKKYNTFKYF